MAKRGWSLKQDAETCRTLFSQFRFLTGSCMEGIQLRGEESLREEEVAEAACLGWIFKRGRCQKLRFDIFVRTDWVDNLSSVSRDVKNTGASGHVTLTTFPCGKRIHPPHLCQCPQVGFLRCRSPMERSKLAHANPPLALCPHTKSHCANFCQM